MAARHTKPHGTHLHCVTDVMGLDTVDPLQSSCRCCCFADRDSSEGRRLEGLMPSHLRLLTAVWSAMGHVRHFDQLKRRTIFLTQLQATLVNA